MNYEIIAINSLNGVQEHVVINREDGSQESFPVDESNLRYQQFLLETSGETPK